MNRISIELLLLKRIVRMKKELIETANKTGLTSNQTLTCSQELDKLINLQMKYFSYNGKKMFINAS